MTDSLRNLRRHLKRRLRNRQPLSRYCRTLGLNAGIKTYWRLVTRHTEPVSITTSQLAAPVFVRPDTTDPYIFEEVFILNEYAFDITGSPRLILDIGANVGYTSIYFACRYPQAHIIAVEPEPSNLKWLHRNTAAYPNIRVVEAGIWNRRTRLKLVDPDAKASDFQLVESDSPDTGIEAVTVDDLFELAQSGHADLVKIDIEGGEKELFEKNTDWLAKVDTLIIELHDRFRAGCKDTFLQAASRYGFSGHERGLNYLARRNGDAH